MVITKCLYSATMAASEQYSPHASVWFVRTQLGYYSDPARIAYSMLHGVLSSGMQCIPRATSRGTRSSYSMPKALDYPVTEFVEAALESIKKRS